MLWSVDCVEYKSPPPLFTKSAIAFSSSPASLLEGAEAESLVGVFKIKTSTSFKIEGVMVLVLNETWYPNSRSTSENSSMVPLTTPIFLWALSNRIFLPLGTITETSCSSCFTLPSAWTDSSARIFTFPASSVLNDSVIVLTSPTANSSVIW